MKARWAILVFGTALAASASVAATGGRVQSPFKPPSNLRVLPADSKLATIVPLMKSFTAGLGVRCEFCHSYTGTDPNALENFDFASDTVPAKVTARKMMAMVNALNAGFLKDIGAPRPADQPLVTCDTCHRGARKPLTVPGLAD